MKGGKTCILIADGDKEIREVLELLLTSQGYAVTTADNGILAQEKACSDVDLYILDVNIPGQSGLMAAANLRKQFDAPIIFLTAYSSESDKVMGFSLPSFRKKDRVSAKITTAATASAMGAAQRMPSMPLPG